MSSRVLFSVRERRSPAESLRKVQTGSRNSHRSRADEGPVPEIGGGGLVRDAGIRYMHMSARSDAGNQGGTAGDDARPFL